MSTDPVEDELVAEGPPADVHLAGTASVVGQLPLEVLVRQLEHAATMNEELRLLLKEERHQLALRDQELLNLRAHVGSLEGSVKLLQELSEARHQEIERLGAHLTATESRLRAAQQSRAWRLVDDYNTVRRAVWRIRARAGRR